MAGINAKEIPKQDKFAKKRVPKKGNTSKEAWKKANAGRDNASNSPPAKAPIYSAARRKADTSAVLAKRADSKPQKDASSGPRTSVTGRKPTPPVKVAVSKASVTGRKPTPVNPTKEQVKQTEAVTKFKETGGNTKVANSATGTSGAYTDSGTGNLPGGAPRPTPPKPSAPSSAAKTASTPQPKSGTGTPPIPASKPAGMGGSAGESAGPSSGGSSAAPKVPNYAVKAIQARSGPGRAPTSSALEPGGKSAGFTNTDATGGTGAKARMANYSYMEREK